MALSRRTGARFQANIWPGFVDAMTGLLLVLMFVLTIFMVVQFTLRETISGQESELDALAQEVAALASALGLERDTTRELRGNLGELRATLDDTEAQSQAQQALIAQLQTDLVLAGDALENAQGRIASFEDQVALLLSERDEGLANIANLEARQTELLSEQDALNLALATARDEIDAGVEAARLAAAQREALDALIADLRNRNSEADANVAELTAQLAETSDALSAEEAAKLAEAAAAEALRERLANADAELTAMSLALEAERKKAEDTLTLLAAAQAAEEDLTSRLAEAVLAQEVATQDIDNLEERLAAALLSTQDAEAQIASLSGSADDLQARLAQALEAQNAAEAEIDRSAIRADDLAARLSAALAARELAETQLNQEAETNAALQSQLENGQLTIADLNAQLAAALTSRQDAEALGNEARDALEALRAELAAREAELAATQEAASNVAGSEAELQKRLADAIAAQRLAQTQAAQNLTDAETRAALLRTAQDELSAQESQTLEAQRQAEALNQQVAALRQQLGGLQALLDDAKDRDAAARVQLESLGTDLNAALARAAAEQRARAEAEAEQRRLEEERAARLAEQAKDLERFRSEFFGRMRDVLGTQEGVRIEGDRFVFASEVLFPPGGADLSDAGRTEIAKVASILRAVGNDIPAEIDWVIRVDGHTDNVPLSGTGEFADNWELSQARALSVVKYMINFLGLPPNRLAANGFGQYQPVNPLDTAEARAQNRRIELKLTER